MFAFGCSLFYKNLKIDWSNNLDSLTFVVTIFGSFFLTNLAYGVALGLITNVLYRLIVKTSESVSFKERVIAISASSYVLIGTGLIVMICFACL